MKVRFHPLAERELIAAALYLDTEAASRVFEDLRDLGGAGS
jgi:hypothetical protein